MNTINDIIKKLKSSPLFYLFLSSKELFHSNFWFWLSELNKQETIKIFTKKGFDCDLIYKREYNQRNGEHKAVIDLCVLADTPKLVIENKVKDFPTLEQLTRIKSSFTDSNNDLEFILVTLFWTSDLNFEGWSVKTYRDISNNINPKAFSNNEYYQSLILDYKEFILNLSYLAENLEVKDEYDFANSFNGYLYAQLNEIKLWETYQKMRASHLQVEFNKIKHIDVKTGYSINNQKATLDFFISIEGKYRIGIQVEDNQYRKFVNGFNAKIFSENLIKNNIFLSPSFKGRGNKMYLNYGSDFKYQYEKIEKMTFDDLFKKINNDIEGIKLNSKEIMAQMP